MGQVLGLIVIIALAPQVAANRFPVALQQDTDQGPVLVLMLLDAVNQGSVRGQKGPPVSAHACPVISAHVLPSFTGIVRPGRRAPPNQAHLILMVFMYGVEQRLDFLNAFPAMS